MGFIDNNKMFDIVTLVFLKLSSSLTTTTYEEVFCKPEGPDPFEEVQSDLAVLVDKLNIACEI